MLGVDGLDAGIARRMMAEGKLPNMARLRDLGGFRPLRTTIPPQSPPAWATVITGLDPGGHGVYDFFHRDPKTYSLTYSTTQIAPPEHSLPVGRWRVPLSPPRTELLRRGRAFWEVLHESGVPCEVHRVPSNFPPRACGVRQLAGLGVPDVRGALGDCSYFSDDPTDLAKGPRVQLVKVLDGRARAVLVGPRNSLEASSPLVTVEFEILVDAAHRVAKIAIQGQPIVLHEREWSDWVPVRFTMLPYVKSATGACRFYMKELSPHLRLYATPLNIDPVEPVLPIDSPHGFAAELVERQGRFHTLGLPEDHGALSAGILDDTEYLHQAGQVLRETRRDYEAALNTFREGALFCFFGTSDRNQHMFWRCIDPAHPAYDSGTAGEFGHVVEDCYRMADEVIGQALDAADSHTAVMAFSDHGFAPYRKHVNLNTWLAQQGYLAVRGGAGSLAQADWGRTSAYALGLQGVYINTRGREAIGTVPEGDREAFARRLAGSLRELRDPETDERVIADVYLPEDVYSEHQVLVAPDLIVGCARGYRISFASAGGMVAPAAVEHNTGKWSGDHTLAANLVPGVVYANRRIQTEAPALADIPATALAEFGLAVPDGMLGRPLW